MSDRKHLLALKDLSADVLGEVVREAEIRVDAQLQAAIASDQRALAWSGFLITITLASMGAATALFQAGQMPSLALVVFAFAVLAAGCALVAMDAVRPSKFCFPGNLPSNWLPDEWITEGSFDLGHARYEQALALDEMIQKNANWAERAANRLRLSMDLTATALILCGVLALVVVVAGF
jgi:hypothetical protein